MKSILSVFICVLLLTTAIKDLVILGFYYGNIDYITDTFCVNKDQTKSVCNGHCHLTKSIADKTNQEKELPLLPTMEEKTIFILVDSNLLTLNTTQSVLEIPSYNPQLISIHLSRPLTPPPEYTS